MTAIEFSNALGKITDKYILEAINYTKASAITEKSVKKFPVQRIKRLVLVAAIITALLLLSAMAYAVIHHFFPLRLRIRSCIALLGKT